jgi:hypothetical protein
MTALAIIIVRTPYDFMFVAHLRLKSGGKVFLHWNSTRPDYPKTITFWWSTICTYDFCWPCLNDMTLWWESRENCIETQIIGVYPPLTCQITIKYACNTSLSTLLVERGKAAQTDAIIVFIRFLCTWGLGRYHSDNKPMQDIDKTLLGSIGY